MRKLMKGKPPRAKLRRYSNANLERQQGATAVL
jgi:hypothetical protein